MFEGMDVDLGKKSRDGIRVICGKGARCPEIFRLDDDGGPDGFRLVIAEDWTRVVHIMAG